MYSKHAIAIAATFGNLANDMLAISTACSSAVAGGVGGYWQ